MAARAEPSPEIAKIGFVHNSLLCESPQYLADELLRLEGRNEDARPELSIRQASVSQHRLG